MPSRDQLIGHVGRYLDALAARDPARAPFAPDARFTENTTPLKLGEGLWATARARRPGGQYFADDGGDQIAWFGVVEAETPVILGLRLKVQGNHITEVETCQVAGGMLYAPDKAAAPRTVWDEAIPALERRPREEMVRITDLYFEGLVHDDGDIIPMSDDVFRIENGLRTANNPTPDPGMAPHFAEMAREGVAEQLNKKRHSYIGAIRDRRYLIVDEARGVTFGVFIFDHPGQSEGALVVPRSSALILESFKIRGGLIHQVEAVGAIIPWQAKSGW